MKGSRLNYNVKGFSDLFSKNFNFLIEGPVHVGFPIGQQTAKQSVSVTSDENVYL